MIGQCDGGEPTAQRCTNSGRLIVERTDLGHLRQRVVCYVHGLDTAPPEIVIPEVSTLAGADLDAYAELVGVTRWPS